MQPLRAPLPGGGPSLVIGVVLTALFWTWQGLEPDRCACIWLIKRFVAPGAEVRLVPRGTRLHRGVPFDVPGARLRRYHNLSAFESMLRAYGLDDPTLVRIGRIIHDLEVNVWEEKVLPETPRVARRLEEIFRASRTPQEAVERCCALFDELYRDLASREGSTGGGTHRSE